MKMVAVELLDKYFADQCSPAEAEQVFDWLATEAGEQYLLQRLEADLEEMFEKDLFEQIFQVSEEVDPETLLHNIMSRLEK